MFQIALKRLREENHMSQSKLAQSIGVAQSTVGMWESGKNKPEYATLLKIANLFGVSVDYLTGNDTTSKPAPLLDRDGLSERDRKDIAKDMESIREKLINKTDGPASFNGENIDDDDAELLLDAIEMMLKRVKKINKVKYNPNKNKSEG